MSGTASEFLKRKVKLLVRGCITVTLKNKEAAGSTKRDLIKKYVYLSVHIQMENWQQCLSDIEGSRWTKREKIQQNTSSCTGRQKGKHSKKENHTDCLKVQLNISHFLFPLWQKPDVLLIPYHEKSAASLLKRVDLYSYVRQFNKFLQAAAAAALLLGERCIRVATNLSDF